MDPRVYSMTEASKFLEERSSVLRYWEDELTLEIARNERGCRIYTCEDMKILCCIRELKKKGYQLKEIHRVIPMLREKDSGMELKYDVRKEAFYDVLWKAMDEMRRQKHREERYKRVDEAIRQHQLARRQIAAARDLERGRKKPGRAGK